jgi:hypothetical protein
MVLPHQFGKRTGTPFTRQDLVAHVV